jgi:hypothetical protein
VDLTTMRDCVIGAYSYVQAGEISHLKIEPGTVWVRKPDDFNFMYRYPHQPIEQLHLFCRRQSAPGCFHGFVEDRKEAFQRVFNVVNIEHQVPVPPVHLWIALP